MSTEVTLQSLPNLAMSLAYMLFQTAEGNNNLFIQLEDTSTARVTGSKTVLKTHAGNDVHVFDVEKLMNALKGFYANPRAESPAEAYTSFSFDELVKRTNAVLRPHEVMFYNPSDPSKPVATKARDSGTINITGTVEEPLLNLLKTLDSTLIQRTTGPQV